MRLDRKKLAALLVLGLGAGIFALTLLQATVLPAAEEEGPRPPGAIAASEAAPADAPVRLRIEKLGVDAKVQHVGVAKSGNMAVPTNYTDVGWYRYGTAPGFLGSAVMDGHVDNGLALPGVFKRLSDLRPGDELVVEAASGAERRFAVVDVETYNYKEVPKEKLFTRTDAAWLNLITCDGTWIAGERTYDRRLVVYAKLI